MGEKDNGGVLNAGRWTPRVPAWYTALVTVLSAILFMVRLSTGPGRAAVAAVALGVAVPVLAAGIGISRGAEAAQAGPAAVTVLPGARSAGQRTFSVVLLCADDASRVKGLQGFRKLRPGEAALFVFDPPQPVAFWMASVPYPLDIVYAGADGVVQEVHRSLQPGDRTVYSSQGRVRWVVETAAGCGIMPGDLVVPR